MSTASISPNPENSEWKMTTFRRRGLSIGKAKSKMKNKCIEGMNSTGHVRFSQSL